MVDSGWKAIAEANNVCLMTLVPAKDSWGNYEDEEAYLDYILNKAGSGKTWYSVFSTFYMVGYGDGGDILLTWAANNPMHVISQTYFNSNVDTNDLAEVGAEEYGSEQSTFETVPRRDVPVPTWIIGEDISPYITIVQPNFAEYPGDRYTTYKWFNDKQIPLFVWIKCAGRSHNGVVSDLWKIWEEWFSKWDMDDNGNRYYDEKSLQ